MLEQAGGKRENLFRVLTYHRVDRPESYPWLDPGLISASPEAFDAQMKYLTANYQPVSTTEVDEAFQSRGRKALPSRAVMVTFDDGYCDFEKQAWPILKQYRIPVTLFVPTAYPDQPERSFWWDKLYNAIHTAGAESINSPLGRLPISLPAQRGQAYRQLKNYFKTRPHAEAMAEVARMCEELGAPARSNPVLGWDALRKIAGEGVELGAHTQTHPIMSRLSPEDVRNEVAGSLQDLIRETGSRPRTFAYPSGMHDREAVKAVQEAGLGLAFTTERGLNDVNRADPLRLRRINVGARTTLPVLRAQLLSWSAPLYSLNNRQY